MPTILIADDEPIHLEIFTEMLKKEGYDVVQASGGEEALHLVDDIKPDLILLDIIMPRISGIDVCKIIRSSEPAKYIPIVMLTAVDSTEYIVEALDAGADDYILKVSDSKVVSSRIRAHLRTKSFYDKDDKKRKDQSVISGFLLKLDSSKDLKEILQYLSMEVSLQIGGRVSVVEIDRENGAGIVIASSDKTEDNEIRIDLNKYPEIICSLETGRRVIVEDVSTNPIVKNVSGILTEIEANSLMVIPLIISGKATLMLRARGGKRGFDSEDIRFCRIIADAVGKAIMKKWGD